MGTKNTHEAVCAAATQRVFQTMLQGARLMQLSQDEIARYLGVSRSTVSGWACGRARMPSDYEVPLSRLMDVAQERWVAAQHQRGYDAAQIHRLYAHKMTLQAQLQHAADVHAVCVEDVPPQAGG